MQVSVIVLIDNQLRLEYLNKSLIKIRQSTLFFATLKLSFQTMAP